MRTLAPWSRPVATVRACRAAHTTHPWTSLTATTPRAGFYGSSRVQARAALLPPAALPWGPLSPGRHVIPTASGRAECRPKRSGSAFQHSGSTFPPSGSTFPAPEARSRPHLPALRKRFSAPESPPFGALSRLRQRCPAVRWDRPDPNHCSADVSPSPDCASPVCLFALVAVEAFNICTLCSITIILY